MTTPLSAIDIRQAKSDATMRDRDLAQSLGISEAQLVAAFVGQHDGQSVTRIAHLPDEVMPMITSLGEVMALTRNESCVHERVGTFEKYSSGQHASMVLGSDIDTRIFPKHWSFGFAVETQTEKGLRKSLQFFDASGDALQKIYMRETSNHDAWAPLVAALKLDDTSDSLEVAPRKPVEGAQGSADKRDALLEAWATMTDTHQFNRITRNLGMNRLGAYRLVSGEKWVRPVAKDSSAAFLNAVSEARQKVILFVGNLGNIQIHWGTLDTIKPMGPWLNVLDPKFNLHLRDDHVAEAYVVEKPTKRGPALSFEAFDAAGNLIFQCFGQKTEEGDAARWANILASLNTEEEALA
ncbi:MULTISPECIES: hemin-degrading factor [Pacificibacter]|uniref:hemin-degrading factor n=1 Tax=Pacificibacter TaxID=1042323 RepID=UPI001C0A27FA|nr:MULTISPECIES: ChuX/HutX family heme-like substrate-binding protein [Pacificibacter]MBU2937769.1 hemin-degrading factor [Pacificibacter marinus]MDO6616030.1 ChuX/HutX family heme-like substrate-binding protein [Pacificibacter sp. 1_MG-2023]